MKGVPASTQALPREAQALLRRVEEQAATAAGALSPQTHQEIRALLPALTESQKTQLYAAMADAVARFSLQPQRLGADQPPLPENAHQLAQMKSAASFSLGDGPPLPAVAAALDGLPRMNDLPDVVAHTWNELVSGYEKLGAEITNAARTLKRAPEQAEAKVLNLQATRMALAKKVEDAPVDLAVASAVFQPLRNADAALKAVIDGLSAAASK